jgi:hypothetical protein
MAIKNSKNKKETKYTTTPQQRTAQIIFAVFALILIASMVLSAISNF